MKYLGAFTFVLITFSETASLSSCNLWIKNVSLSAFFQDNPAQEKVLIYTSIPIFFINSEAFRLVQIPWYSL